MNQTLTSTLSNSTEEYLLQRGVDKKKYFSRYLVIAKRVYQDIFRNTLYVTESKWMPLLKGEPYNYVNTPPGMERLFSVSEEDECHKIVPLYFNPRLNVIKKPTEKKCSCDACDCGGLCEDVNSMSYTTKLLFTINGVDYYEKTWTKYCPNGDILLYREVPTKKYNSYIGDTGDYNNDHMNDFDIANPGFSNFEIVTQVFQEKLCSLTVQPCGCPEETPENEQLLNQFCSCFLPLAFRRKKFCDHFLSDINSNGRGEVKISECGTRIYYNPAPVHRRRPDKKLPDYLLVNYQTNGLIADAEVLVPEYSLNCLFTGIDFYSKRFNNSFGPVEKREAMYAYRHEQNELIKYLNPISLEWLSNVQDAPIKW